MTLRRAMATFEGIAGRRQPRDTHARAGGSLIFRPFRGPENVPVPLRR